MKALNSFLSFIPQPVRNKLKYWHFRLFRLNKPCGYGEVYRVTMQKALNTFVVPELRQDSRYIRFLKKDIIKCWILYHALPYEYFLFQFEHKNHLERFSFETDMDRLITLRRVSSFEMFQKQINDKYEFYLLARDFFKRDAIRLDSEVSFDKFASFVRSHPSVFYKPLKSSKGKGAGKYDYSSIESIRYLYDELLAEGGAWMVEERITQSWEMAQWNESSVNTIRVPSFLKDGKFTVIWTRMRMGKKGSIVDNAGAGGIVVNVDPYTGVIASDGIDESYNHFSFHPDSGLVFKGWKVPRWNELLNTVEKIHRTIFNQHIYIAWDFALTDDGWVVIEGNWGQLLGYQTASQKGVRYQFHELVGEPIIV